MKTPTYILTFSSLLLSTAFAHCQTAARQVAIPYKPDPPFTIDGNLDDWNGVPDKVELNNKDHVAYGADKWKGAKDLSATVQLAWREETLYVAADVTDDVFRQNQRGANLWKGDHLELYLDTAPETDPGRVIFGEHQFEIGLSPGNFAHTGDALTDIAPEAYVFLPQGTSAQGTQVAAKSTATGYTIEAAIPWSVFSFKPGFGLPLGVEVAVSDTDSMEAAQEKMMTIATTNWQRSRARLLPAVLAHADGSAPALITNTPLFDNNTIKPGESVTIPINAPAVPQGYEAILSLNARLDAPKPGGYAPALHATLNGVVIDSRRLINKKVVEERVNGKSQSSFAGNSFIVPYAPDFDATDTDKAYALKNAKAALLEFRVTDLLKSAGNVLVIQNAVRSDIDRSLVVGNAKLLYRIPSAPKVLSGPPTGPLPMVAPQPAKPEDYQVTQHSPGNFTLQFNKNTFDVSSRYSTPAGKWVSDSNKYFSVRRQIEKKDEWIIVRDTFTNLTKENLPLMHRDEVTMKPDKIWLGGLSPSNVTGESNSSSNPTVFGVQGSSGIGLLPLDDVFQVHIKNYSTGSAIGLADENLVLKPQGAYTAEWAIVPVATADYFDFINATRRLLDVNFSIDGSFAFMRADPNAIGKWSDQEIINFVRYKDAKYLCLGPNYPRYKGLIPQGTQLQKMDLSGWKTAIARRRSLLPDVKQMAYFHSYLDASDDAPEEYRDSQLILANGAQGDYGQSPYKLFVPTLTDSYGATVAKNIDLILDEMKLDGVYWDEFQESRYAYTYNDNQWDGCSADIDPQTMRITRLKSSVTLLSLPWRLEQVKRILQNHLLITNGGTPYTKEMRDLHHPAFAETGSISNLRSVQLYTPIALGDHLTERSEEDAYHVMLNALNYGALYYWYNDMTVIPAYHTLTEYMYPITPVELHNGYVIGKERIITGRSGIFGWNDNSPHEVHVFDNTGREVNLKDIKAPTVVKTYKEDGKTWTEIRIGEDWSAAIVRK